ncbi:2,4'-dihydroxyacetophenone dioxygenase (plasmid) [Burkholderia sp. SFA1]|uniref:2,4'-dihydroxyacetophenone dioxygenase family protein n=1 Tax=unclassified Caballeronia TaxID=2646786 RepID=UPI001F2CAB1B|nr:MULTISPECIES: 2,4'-dihydroxyacetophenone dioxygenase family protein [unclassified Caballeronia]MCE4546639.1 2,4'-dihydroxyacetophenone dioxygenase family protein [Caballeronia sp. PC1]MCE4572888.1 2,4'-dihydroxyacetophenone dioxygenase family protein [Caballeronia sp. CLC5]BBQ01734.1 2,4'-dihydroxyacetophenone dioxygenase [Burkholderia sp. SFA1]
MALPTHHKQDKDLFTIDSSKEPWVKDFPHRGSDVCPLFFDAQNGTWVLRARLAPGVLLPNHFHTGTVHLFTMAGQWNYTQYPHQPQTAGSYLYEPGGSIHQFTTPASNNEMTDMFMVIQGANINFDDEGNFINIADAGFIEAMINKAAKDRGMSPLNYIRALGARSTAM